MAAYCTDCTFKKKSKNQNQSYHSANPISLPSYAHQISLSSSLASIVVVVGTAAATGWDVPLSSLGLFWHVTRTPSVLMRATPRHRALPPSPPSTAASPRPESMRKSCNVLSSIVLTFCRGSHTGCEKPQGARSKTWVCVGAANSHKARGKMSQENRHELRLTRR